MKMMILSLKELYEKIHCKHLNKFLINLELYEFKILDGLKE